jgi:hypothetical protein
VPEHVKVHRELEPGRLTCALDHLRKSGPRERRAALAVTNTNRPSGQSRRNCRSARISSPFNV